MHHGVTFLLCQSVFTCHILLYAMVLKTISPGCGVRASLMLFFKYEQKDIVLKKNFICNDI